MRNESKQQSNPFSTGGGGPHFEAHVQAMFVTLMLARGYVSYLPPWPVTRIDLQCSHLGYNVDDVMVTVEDPDSKRSCKLAAQIKYSIHITMNDSSFADVMKAAWSDFNNWGLFDNSQDRLALITGPGSAIHDAAWLLQQAKYSSDAEEFKTKVELEGFSSIQKQRKYEALRHQLTRANNDIELSNETYCSFLRCFHLVGHDLGNETGGDLSLVYSLMSQAKGDPRYLWSRIVEVVQTRNQYGGTITLDNLPEDLRKAFERPQPTTHVTVKLVAQPASSDLSWNRHSSAPDLVSANFLGAWNENSEADLAIVRQLSKTKSAVWLQNIREALSIPASPLSLRDGRWQVNDRNSLWQSLGETVFDDHLARFEEAAVCVLSERDPKFKLPAQDRFAAPVYGAVLSHSLELRKGLAESLALLGNQGSHLKHCTLHKAENVAAISVRRIFEKSDWILWGSMGNLLQTLAEASPNEFLKAVENDLRQNPCPFDELFLQEGNSVFGESLVTGLLWAMETLAWHEDYLIRVCVVLGDLASRDPGGNWAKRPASSLLGILHPSRPHTNASVLKQRVAVETLRQEFPEVAWKLVRQLSSASREYPFSTHRPIWRESHQDNRSES